MEFLSIAVVNELPSCPKLIIPAISYTDLEVLIDDVVVIFDALKGVPLLSHDCDLSTGFTHDAREIKKVLGAQRREGGHLLEIRMIF